MCIQQQQKSIHYETLDGKRGTIHVPSTSTEEQYDLSLKRQLQVDYGWKEDDIQLEYDEATHSYIVLYDSVFNKFVRSCSVREAKTEEDKQNVQDELKQFVNEKNIKELDLTEIYAHFAIITIKKCAFFGCSSLVNIIIPESITTIHKFAFSDCSSLKMITFPTSLTTIDKFAFDSCSSLTSIILSHSITKIEAYAFSLCESLASITLTNSITIIGYDAFPPNCIVSIKP